MRCRRRARASCPRPPGPGVEAPKRTRLDPEGSGPQGRRDRETLAAGRGNLRRSRAGSGRAAYEIQNGERHVLVETAAPSQQGRCPEACTLNHHGPPSRGESHRDQARRAREKTQLLRVYLAWDATPRGCGLALRRRQVGQVRAACGPWFRGQGLYPACRKSALNRGSRRASAAL
jgi:hypothetical protein